MERWLFRLNAKGMITVIHVPGNCYLSFLYLYWKHCYMYHQNAHVNLHLFLSSEPSIFLSDEIFSEICNVSLAQDKYNCWI